MRRTPSLLLCAVVVFLSTACIANAAPEWRHAAHHDRKLFADVLLGDERGTYWDDKLPEGWVWLADPKVPAEDYYRLDQVEPKVVDGKVIFIISKWNFFGINGQHGFSTEQLIAKAKEIEASADVRFRESDEETALMKRFSAMDLKEAEKALEGAKEELLPKGAEKNLLVVKAKSGTVAAILFERLGSVNLIRTRILTPPTGGGDLPAERFETKPTDTAWSFDLDDADKAQIDWTPSTATTEASLKPAAGAVLAPAGSAK